MFPISNRNKDIIVIGAGVSGLTSAILCLLCGFKVKVLTKQHPLNGIVTSDFSSHFPAASIIPHSVDHPELLSIFEVSNSFFNELYQNNTPGIEKHIHFELFSTATKSPDYAECVESFERISFREDEFYPAHPTHKINSGWKFDCLFADWGIYYPFLFKNFLRLGGQMEYSEIDEESLSKLPSEIVVNCAEIYGTSLLGEDFKPCLYRGHLIHIPGMKRLTDLSGKTISYNFTPDLEIYSTEKGNEQDVYFYQRNDRWIFGGSRQKGTIDDSGNWIGEKVIEPLLEFDKVSIPEQILRLNLEIVEHTFGQHEINIDLIEPKIGYRFMGNSEEHLRIDTVEIGDKLIINNLGHGGSGVTLSWGCALRVIGLLNDRLHNPEIDRRSFIQNLVHL